VLAVGQRAESVGAFLDGKRGPGLTGSQILYRWH
jgi:hypothetical protein